MPRKLPKSMKFVDALEFLEGRGFDFTLWEDEVVLDFLGNEVQVGYPAYERTNLPRLVQETFRQVLGVPDFKVKPSITKKEFLNKTACPMCKSGDFEWGEMETHGDAITHDVHCNNCGTKFYEDHKLVGYGLL